MFGLPIITHFKDASEPVDTSLKPILVTRDIAERMASPLILRPIKVGKGKWAAGALLLPIDHVREMGLLLDGAGVNRSMPAGTWWSADSAAQIPPMALLGKDPLEAFLAGFTKRQWPDGSKAGRAVTDAQVRADRTFERPTLKRDTANASISVQPKDGSKAFVLLRDQAASCMAALSEYARSRLLASKPFDRLKLTVKGDQFVSLEEYRE